MWKDEQVSSGEAAHNPSDLAEDQRDVSLKGNLFQLVISAEYEEYPAWVPINIRPYPERRLEMGLHLFWPGYGSQCLSMTTPTRHPSLSKEDTGSSLMSGNSTLAYSVSSTRSPIPAIQLTVRRKTRRTTTCKSSACPRSPSR